MLLAKTDPDAEPRAPRHDRLHRREGAGGREPPGLTIPMPPLKKLGYKGVESTELVFDGFRTPAVERARRRGGRRPGLQVLHERDRGRPRQRRRARRRASRRRALDDAIRYAQEREAFGKPIAHHQAIQLMLAKMATRPRRRGCSCSRRPQAKARGERADLEAGMAKYFATEAAAGERARLHAHPRRLRLLARVPPPSATTATRRCS